MTQEIGKPSGPSIPPPPKPKSASWFNRFICFLGFAKKDVQQTAKKTEVLSIKRPEKQEIEATQLASKRLVEDFEQNKKQLYKLKSSTLNFWRVEKGRLQKTDSEQPKEMQEEVIALSQQTYRQAWGRLIEAHHGLRIKEAELFELNKLFAHLSYHCPEALPRGPENQPLRALTESYRTQKVKGGWKLKRAVSKARQEIEKKVNNLRKKLYFASLKKGETGVNPTAFVSIEEDEDFKKIAIEKSINDEAYGDVLFELLGAQDDNATKYYSIGGINESMISSLNLLLEGHLGNPLIATARKTTTHAFLEEAETLKDYMRDAKTEESQIAKLEKLSQLASQRFIFLQLASGNFDSHSQNIMVQNAQPIGIDFGRSFPLDPLNPTFLTRTAYLSFPCLDQPLDPQEKAFYETLDISSIMNRLQLGVKEQYKKEYRDPDLAKVLDQTLFQLHARLVMIQEGVRQGLNQRQLLALQFPPLSNEDKEKIRTSPTEWAKRSVLVDIFKTKGFYKAWVASYKTKDIEAFKKQISSEIASIKSYSGSLYDQTTKEAYQLAGLSLPFSPSKKPPGNA